MDPQGYTSRDEALRLLGDTPQNSAAMAGGLASAAKAMAGFALAFTAVTKGIPAVGRLAVRTIGATSRGSGSAWRSVLGTGLASAREAAKRTSGGTTTEFLAHLTEAKGGSFHRMFSTVHKATSGQAYQQYVTGSRKAMTQADRWSLLKPSLAGGRVRFSGRADSADIAKGIGAAYFKETAMALPAMYAMDRKFGEQKDHISWYNVPGRAMDFAKYIPEYVGFDVAGRGAMMGVGMAKAGLLAKARTSSGEGWFPDALNKVSKVTEWYNKSGNKFRGGLEAASDHMRAAKGSWQNRVDARARIDNTNISRLKITGPGTREGWQSVYREQLTSVTDARKNALDSKSRMEQSGLFEQQIDSLTTSREQIADNMGSALRKKDESEGFIKDFTRTHFAQPGRSDYSSGTERFIMRALGVRRAKFGDFDEITQGKVRKQLRQFSGKVSELDESIKEQDLVDLIGAGKHETDTTKLNSLLANQHVYYSKSADKVFDLRKWTPGGVIDNAFQKLGRSGSLGSAISTLYPVRSAIGAELPTMINVDDTVPIMFGGSANITSAGRSSSQWMGEVTGETGSLHNAFNFTPKDGAKGSSGLILRDPGKRTYTLYGRDEGKGGMHALARDLRPMSSLLSEKSGRLVYEDASYIPKQKFNEFRGPLAGVRNYIFDKTGLGHHTGNQPSLFEMAANFINRRDPTKPNYILNPQRSRIGKLTGDKALWKTKSPTERAELLAEANASLSNLRSVENEAYRKVLLQDKAVYKELLVDNAGNLHNYNDAAGIGGTPLSEPGLTTDQFVYKLMHDPVEAKRVATRLLNQSDNTYKKIANEHDLRSYIENQIIGKPDSFLIKSHGQDTPHLKLLRFIGDVNSKAVSLKSHMNDDPVARAVQAAVNKTGRFSDRDLAGAKLAVESRLFRNKHADAIKSFKNNVNGELVFNDDTTNGIAALQQLQHSTANDQYLKQTPFFKRFGKPSDARSEQMQTINTLTDKTPYVLVGGKSPVGMGATKFMGRWAYDTFGSTMDLMGLGWDRGKYQSFWPKLGNKEHQSVGALFAKRALLFAGIETMYDAVDTFTDVTPIFAGTMFDEGISTAGADHAVRLRMGAGKVYDAIGVTAAAKYMEGLMPKSSKILPGAAMGFMAYGVPGAAVGAVLNSYVQPQLSEGPLSFLAAIPMAAPFVADLTKSHEELQDLYTGRDLTAWRKGAGWTLGTTPIEGGRVDSLVPNWYARMKSSADTTAVQYGSRLEKFIFKDRAFIDFSLGDLIDPQYLTRKHYYDRPYVEPDVPFSEMPLIGPTIGTAIGKMYNALHPLGSNKLMHLDEARRNMASGVSGAGTGAHESGMLAGFGEYTGVFGEFDMGTQVLPGLGLISDEYVNRSSSLRAAAGEQVYRGFIEPAGLSGFLTSTAMWGGNEPFSDEAYLESSSSIDSTTRSLWDRNLGDLLLTNEGLRRLYPRPRTSFDKVNPINNLMPGWMPEEYRTGDPYCLTSKSEVEIISGIKRADEVQVGDLIRTSSGRYTPVAEVIPRKISEKVYTIKLKESDATIQVTGDHPFLINSGNRYQQAKLLKKEDSIVYPLRDLTTVQPYIVPAEGKSGAIMLTGGVALALGILVKYGILFDDTILLRDCPVALDELKFIFKEHLNCYITKSFTIDRLSVVSVFKQLLKYGIPDSFYKVGTYVFLQFAKHFMIPSEDGELQFTFPTRSMAYQAWSIFAQDKLLTELTLNSLHVRGSSASVIHYMLTNIPINYSLEDEDRVRPRTALNNKTLWMSIEWVRRDDYTGTVYGFSVDTDDSFCVLHACTHNTKKPFGEYILPGAGYEAGHDITVDYPTGGSRLGYNPYDQALSMVGLTSIDDDETLEILEGGTAIHRMVQHALKAQNSRVKTEALVTDPEHRISSYVDVVLPKDFSGQEVPLEVKTINPLGFQRLTKPKYKNSVQLNAYMHMMGVNKGRMMYVNREDPTQVKTYDTYYSEKMWQETVSNLDQARTMADSMSKEGYGTNSAGYSYTDRFEVLLSAAPFGKEFRETTQLVGEQAEAGLLSDEQLDRIKMLKSKAVGIISKYEMYDKRFKGIGWIAPDGDYKSYNMNHHIKEAAAYSMPERVAGAAWEHLTSYRSYLHTKLFGVYTPEETYENEVISGKSFQSWGAPIEGLVKPWLRNLAAAEGPIQGAMSYGTAGAVLGGPFGAAVGTVAGATYGAAHGLYRKVSGTSYRSDNFQTMDKYAEYFDVLKYDKASRMYAATQDPRYLNQMSRTAVGYNIYESDPETLSDNASYAFQAAAIQGNPNQGHHSPWNGTDVQEDLGFDTTFNLGQSFGSVPYWDRPFYKAFLNTTDPNDRQRILEKVDVSMARVLAKAWNDPELRTEALAFDSEDYFKKFNRPDASDSVMHPLANQGLFEMKTLDAAGEDSHDYGLGWRDQVKEAERSLVVPRSIDINGASTYGALKELDPGELQAVISQQLMMSGIDFKLDVTATPSNRGDTVVRFHVEIQRDSAREISKKSNGR